MYAHLITFPVASTNIFPLVNSTQGGQLVTEFNLKSRDMVMTNPAITYAQGPSFTHSLEDFKVTLYSDPETGSSASTSILQVNAGRAVINGHYVESLSPMIIDLDIVNTGLKQNAQEPLYGNLSIGIRSYFSTETTMAGSMLVENSESMYVGIQLVIAKDSEFITPNDSPNDRDAVNADLKLADFTYVNGAVAPASIHQNPNATRYIPSERIFDFDSILDEVYVTTNGTNERKFYSLSGKSKSWCDSTGSLMIWDKDPYHEPRLTTVEPTLDEAKFIYEGTGVSLAIPHKQIDGDVFNDQGQKLYYADRHLPIPQANYDTGAPGVVSPDYTQHIKNVENALNSYKQFTNGKQIKFLESLTDDTKTEEFASINPDNFNVGDYILVRADYTVYSGSATEGTAPSTMYVILPGGVTSIAWQDTTKPSGVRLGTAWTQWAGVDPTPTSTVPTAEELLAGFNYTSFQGESNDYFELIYRDESDDSQTSYYYKVSSTGPKLWSEPILLTGGIPLATEDQAGGFYNAPTSATDAGYVYLDNTGHLRLIDYELLRSGTLAYQLGEDKIVPKNSTIDYIKSYLDEYINGRVAFPFNTILATTPSMINVEITLPADGSGVINICDIDSRFGTGVYIHFTADDNTANYSNIIINITNCEKVRIDSGITTWTNGPIINIFRSCLYYDAAIINYIRTCDTSNPPKRESLFPSLTNFTGFKDFTIWYSRFSASEPDLVVNGMEVSQPDVAMATEEISFWNESITADNHYLYALRSITLSNSGRVIGCSLYVGNGTSQVPVTGSSHVIIGGDFILPQGSQLNYPVACINSPLQITGVFTAAYKDNTGTKWITTETSFTARTGTYSKDSGLGNGSIAFNSKTDLLDTTYTNVDHIDGWEPDSFHIFYGGTTV